TRRLQSFLEVSVETLLELGPDVVGLFLPLGGLLARLGVFAAGKTGVGERLQALYGKSRRDEIQLSPDRLIEQVTRSLQGLAAKRPLLLIIDDLQWTDAASASLFFHLSRQLSGHRILLVGAYRPEEIALGRGDQRHPLEKVLNEIKRYQGEVWLDLDQTRRLRGRQFVSAYLDSSPNGFSGEFRRALTRHTGGHALFTVELLHYLKSRGDVYRDTQDVWRARPALDWSVLPPRVEGVIEERVQRVDSALREILSLASLEGESFTAQVVAALQQVDELLLLRDLSRELSRRHQLVAEIGEIQVGERTLTRFEFAHPLFQQYLYHQLGAGERRLLHGEVVALLEAWYAGRTDEICHLLARHTLAAGQSERAAKYLLLAGDRARLLYAYEDAVQAYSLAIQQLRAQAPAADPNRLARALMKLGLTYHLAFDYPSARQAFNEAFAIWQRAPVAQTPPPTAIPLRVDWPYPPLGLDPAQAADTDTIGVIDQLFCGLVALSPEMDLLPELAESWEVEDRGLLYRFRLRPDLRWSDGSRLTAADLEFAWKRVLDPQTASPLAQLLYGVYQARAYHQGEQEDPRQVGIAALDERTLAVRLEQPAGNFLYVLTHPGVAPVPRHRVQALGDAWSEPDNLVGCGPFIVQPGCSLEALRLQRNPFYHGRGTGNVVAIELVGSEAPEGALARYDAGELSIVQLQRGEGPDPRQRYPADYRSLPYLATAYLGFRVDRPPFDDPRLRRALAHAIDRETLASVHLQGYVFPALGGLIPPGMPGHTPDSGLVYDPEEATRLLSECGTSFRDLDAIEIWTEVGKESSACFLAEGWQMRLGLPVACRAVEWEDLTARLEVDPPPLFLNIWAADYPDPETFLRDCDALRWTRWRNPRFDRLVDQARRQTDMAERLELYRNAERGMVEQAVLVPLAYWRTHLLVHPSVQYLPSSSVKWWTWKDVLLAPDPGGGVLR
ncbi:MAG: hypothetical protein JXC32_00085, partial [Anaerolineae bacterium]|nr:hypothetical protein [Anaerolineae bacterium]